jgi:hypothetical protein
MIRIAVAIVIAIVMWIGSSNCAIADVPAVAVTRTDVITLTKIVSSDIKYSMPYSNTPISVNVDQVDMQAQVLLQYVEEQPVVVSVEILSLLPTKPKGVFGPPEIGLGTISGYPTADSFEFAGVVVTPNDNAVAILLPDSFMGRQLMEDENKQLLETPQATLVGVIKLDITNTTQQTITILSDYVTLIVNGEQAYVSRSLMSKDAMVELGPGETFDKYGLPFVLYETTYDSIERSGRLHIRLVGPHINDKHEPMYFDWEFKGNGLSTLELLDLTEGEFIAVTICSLYQYADANDLDVFRITSEQAQSAGAWSIKNNRVCAKEVDRIVEIAGDDPSKTELGVWGVFGCMAGKIVIGQASDLEASLDACMPNIGELSSLAESLKALVGN